MHSTILPYHSPNKMPGHIEFIHAHTHTHTISLSYTHTHTLSLHTTFTRSLNRQSAKIYFASGSCERSQIELANTQSLTHACFTHALTQQSAGFLRKAVGVARDITSNLRHSPPAPRKVGIPDSAVEKRVRETLSLSFCLLFFILLRMHDTFKFYLC